MKKLQFLFLLVLGLSSCNDKKSGVQSISESKQDFAKITAEYGIGILDKDPNVFNAKTPEGEQMELFVIGYKKQVPVFYNELTNCTYLLLKDSLKKMDCFDIAKKKLMFCHDSLSVFYSHIGKQGRYLIITMPEHSDTIQLSQELYTPMFFFNQKENKLYFCYPMEGAVLQVVDLEKGTLSEEYLNGNLLYIINEDNYIYYLLLL